MAVVRGFLRLGAVAALVCPAVGMHGFIDSVFTRGRHSQAESSDHNIGRTLMDALRFAMDVSSSSSSPADTATQVDGIPSADKMFEEYDSEAPHGHLSNAESGGLLKELGFTADEIQQMQREMDVNGDHQITKKEFNSYIDVPEEPQQPQKPQQPREAADMVEDGTAPAPAQPAKAPAAADQVVESVPSAPAPPSAEPAAVPPSMAEETVNSALPPAETPQLPKEEVVARKPKAAAYEMPEPTVKPGSEPVLAHDPTARSMQTVSARTQDTLVDAIENVQMAEIKRTVFRSLARLRTAQIREFDTIARLQFENINDFNDKLEYSKNDMPISIPEDERPVTEDKYASFHH
mmetsp:Transcript_59665/g.177531  ORF Transcript_59665/g.177531 Transcript_59665/m.177531 type:complete len:349 (+) Transcript_59665:56-1102(+)